MMMMNKLAHLNRCHQLLHIYTASTMNLHVIWFTDEKTVHRVSIKQLRGYKVRCLESQKLNHLASSVCWCIVLLERVKVKLSHQARERDRFGHFLGLQL